MKRIGTGLAAGVTLATLGLMFGTPAHVAAAQADKGFVQEAASGGKMEVELGQYASRHALSPDVKKFGERMANDHSRVNAQLEKIAERESIELPAEPNAKHAETVQRLTSLKGAEFDRAYMKAMVEDHEEDVAKFRDVASSAESKQVKEFAQKTLPTLQEHLKMAKDIDARIEKHASAAK
jgi:putative membrane protein